jgi:hypothetical protein
MTVHKVKRGTQFQKKELNNEKCHKSVKIENIFKTLVCRRKIKKTWKYPIPNHRLDNTVTVKFKTGLLVCRICIIVRMYIVLAKMLQRISKNLVNRIWAIMKEAA